MPLFVFAQLLSGEPALFNFFINCQNRVGFKVGNDKKDKNAAGLEMVNVFSTVFFVVCKMQKDLLGEVL